MEMTIASQVVATTPMTFDVPHSMVCDGETVTEIEISLPGVAVGDQLQVNGGRGRDDRVERSDLPDAVRGGVQCIGSRGVPWG